MPSPVSGTTAAPSGSAGPAPCNRLAKMEETSAKPRKNAIASGVTTKCAKLAPKRNMTGDAIRKGRKAFFR